jgi:hypothetical protein
MTEAEAETKAEVESRKPILVNSKSSRKILFNHRGRGGRREALFRRHFTLRPPRPLWLKTLHLMGKLFIS